MDGIVWLWRRKPCKWMGLYGYGEILISAKLGFLLVLKIEVSGFAFLPIDMACSSQMILSALIFCDEVYLQQ
jgi:hypothetical protein